MILVDVVIRFWKMIILLWLMVSVSYSVVLLSNFIDFFSGKGKLDFYFYFKIWKLG